MQVKGGPRDTSRGDNAGPAVVVVEINFVGRLTLVEHVKVAVWIAIRASVDVIRRRSSSVVLFLTSWLKFSGSGRYLIIRVRAAVVITNFDLWVML